MLTLVDGDTNKLVCRGNANENSYYPRLLQGPFTKPFRFSTELLKDYQCDDHFFFLSRNPLGTTYTFSSVPDTIFLGFDCRRKYVHLPNGAKIKESCG